VAAQIAANIVRDLGVMVLLVGTTTAMERTPTVFPPFRVNLPTPSAILATQAIGGVALKGTMAKKLTTGICATPTRLSTIGHTISLSYLVFVVCKTKQIVLANQMQCVTASRKRMLM